MACMRSEDALKNYNFFSFILQKVIALHSRNRKIIARKQLLVSLYTNHFSGLLGKALKE